MQVSPALRFWRFLLTLPVALSLVVLISPAVYVTVAAPAGPAVPVARYDWLQFNGDPQHSGNNTRETAIGASNLASMRRLFRIPLPSIVDSAPVFLSAVNTRLGVRDLLFMTTKQGDLLAVDAGNGDVIWSQQHGPGSCRVNNGSTPCYTTAGPAIDPNRQYIYTYGLDGYVHKHRVDDGTEVRGGGWPELATLKPYDEKGSSNLAIATAPNGKDAFLYAANAGYPDDAGDYQGHVTTINLSDGSQRVFNANCSNQAAHIGPGACRALRSAIWARPGVVYSSATSQIYAATGNGTFNPASHDWGDSVLALNVDGTGANGDPLQTYTPSNQAQLEQDDADLGSTAPAILPLPPNSNSTVRHLAVQGGKIEYPPASPDRALLRLLNLDNLNGKGGAGSTGGEVGQVPLPQGGGILTQPAVWVNPQDVSTWVFIANPRGIAGLQLQIGAGGIPTLVSRWTKSGGGTSPIVANGVLFYAGEGRLRALNPLDGALLWSDSGLGSIHWESPIVANGVVYITDDASQLTAYIPSAILSRPVYLPLILR